MLGKLIWLTFALVEVRGQEVCDTQECRLAAESILNSLDLTAEPCTDFYQFACGGWMAKNSIPEGKSKWGRFYELRDKVDQALHEIVEMESGESEAEAVKNLRRMYAGCMDTAAMEAVGLGALLDKLTDPVDGWPMVLDSWNGESYDLESALGGARREFGVNWLLSTSVYLDDLNTNQNVIYVDQPDLGLPLSMYLEESSYTDYIAAYKQFMVDIALVVVRESGSGITEEAIVAAVEQVYQLEKQIAAIMTPDSERRNSTAMYNPMTVAELNLHYAGFDWNKYFNTVFQDSGFSVDDSERVIVVQPDYLENTQQVETSPETIVNYLFSRFMMKIAEELTTEMRDISFKFTAALTGVDEQPERWQTCTAKATGGWGFAAAHEYVLNYFDSESKNEADMMVENLRAAFKELVAETEWMDGNTQDQALDKADRMLQLMGYPDWLVHDDQVDQYYEGSLAADPAHHLLNVLQQLAWSSVKSLSELRKVPKRDVWLSHPAIVNAWYSPNHNTITFPAGILQFPFFQGSLPRYINYGAMGMVIGHEITHGFDDQGRQYDGTGNLQPWWSEETLQGFLERADCFIQQYTNYTVPELIDILGEEDAHLNGKNTQGENIADNGGIRESFRAYLNSLDSLGDEPALPGLETFTPKQMFFVSNAQVWCEIQTPESLLGQVLGDPHSPGRFRVLGPLSNSRDFQREWNCPADSPMVRPNNCQLW